MNVATGNRFRPEETGTSCDTASVGGLEKLHLKLRLKN